MERLERWFWRIIYALQVAIAVFVVGHLVVYQTYRPCRMAQRAIQRTETERALPDDLVNELQRGDMNSIQCAGMVILAEREAVRR